MGTPLEDPETKSIGVAAGDFDADGREEVEINHFLGYVQIVFLRCNHE